MVTEEKQPHLNSTDRTLGCPSLLRGAVIIDHRGMHDQTAQRATRPGLNRELRLSSLSGQYLCQHQFKRTLKRKEKLTGPMHVLPPSLGKMEALHSPFAKNSFTKPPGSLPARAKQRGLENQRTNQPKQPTESKEKEAPPLQMEPTSIQLSPLEPSSAQLSDK